MSYSFQGTASWLTQYQSNRTVPQNPSIGPSPREDAVTPERILTTQVVLVDSVIHAGPRQYGWADTKAALITLLSWFYLSGPVTAGANAEWGDVQLNHGRIRQFAKTIIGGMCRSAGVYQEAGNNALGPLEVWLRQCLMTKRTTPSWKTNLDAELDAFVTLEDWVNMPVAGRIHYLWKDQPYQEDPAEPEEGRVVPEQEWLRSALESKVRSQGDFFGLPRIFKLTSHRASLCPRAPCSKTYKSPRMAASSSSPRTVQWASGPRQCDRGTQYIFFRAAVRILFFGSNHRGWCNPMRVIRNGSKP